MVALLGQPNCLTWAQLTFLTDPHLFTDNQLELLMALIGFWILDYSGPAGHLRSLPQTAGASYGIVSAGAYLCYGFTKVTFG